MSSTISAVSKPLPQTLPRRYLPVEMIGQGGMGIVYRVVDQLAGDLVALKQLNPGFRPIDDTSDAMDRVSIAHEFRMLSMLRHPYILPALDFGFGADSLAYFTMPLLQNPQTILEFTANQPFPDQVNMLMQILQALAYLHQHGVIHNDLKPNNILVVNGRVQLLDFGVSSIVGEPRDFLAGTPRYIAPEMLRLSSPTRESDLYAVGVIAYEVFSNLTTPAGTSWYNRPTPADARQLNIDTQVREIVATLL